MNQLPPIEPGRKRVLAIDPGTWESGVIVYDFFPDAPDEGSILFIAKDMANQELLDFLIYGFEEYESGNPVSEVAIEMVGFYGTGLTVGKEVFHTVLWIGRYYAALERFGIPINLYLRKKIAVELCGRANVEPKHILQACKDRLGEPGNKANPGKTYGVSTHAWDALAVALSHAAQIAPVDYPGTR